MKKLIAVILAVLMIVSMTACSSAKKDTYVIGICQIAPHDALDAATKGFMDALTEVFGEKVTFKKENAGGEYNNCTTIIDGFVVENVDMILANATAPLQAAAGKTDQLLADAEDHLLALAVAKREINGDKAQRCHTAERKLALKHRFAVFLVEFS